MGSHGPDIPGLNLLSSIPSASADPPHFPNLVPPQPGTPFFPTGPRLVSCEPLLVDPWDGGEADLTIMMET